MPRHRPYVCQLASLAAFLSLVAVAQPALADGGADKGIFGVGLIVGEPTGIAAKYYLANDVAIDGAVGAAILGRGIQAHADILWHPWILEQTDSFALPVYLGVGLRIINHNEGGSDDDYWGGGVRVPIGIMFDFTEIPIDVFAELAGVAELRSGGGGLFGIAINGGVGARYYF